MNVVSLRRATPAEDAVMAQAESGLQDAGEARRDAVATLRREGLPHRRVEAWHYTDLRSLVGSKSAASAAAPPHGMLSAPLLPNSLVIEAARATAASLAGLRIERTAALPDWQRTANHLDREIDTVRLLTAAFGAPAVSVLVDAGIVLERPLELRADATGHGERSYVTCELEAGAGATVVERFGAGAGQAISASVADLTLGEGAEVLWIVDQGRGGGETHLAQLNVALGKDAKFRLFVLNTGGAVVRQEVHTVTQGEGAEIVIRGVNLIEDGQHVDVTTTLNHVAPHTNATEIFRNVVLGGHGVFQGMIRVAKGAQKTDAKLACNTLLLSDDGEFSAKPELEIFADDVLCGHGATVSEIDADHLFYLMSRGIPKAQARSLLVRAFVDEVVEELEDEAIVTALEARIDAWLERER